MLFDPKKNEYRRMRKQFIREQKASIKRQRNELRQNMRRSAGGIKPGLLGSLGAFFSTLFTKRQISSGSEQLRTAQSRGLFTNWKLASEDRQSRKREKMQNKERMRTIRKKINYERRQYFKQRFLRFLQNPFPKRKLSNDQKYIIDLAKRERKKLFRQRMKSYPSEFKTRTSQFWKNRLDNLIITLKDVRFFMREFIQVIGNRVLSKSYLITTLNSLAVFITSFLMIYLINQFATIITASYYEIPAVLYSYRIYWPLYTYSTLYTRGALIVIFGIGPAICLILAFVFFRLFLFLKLRTRLLRTFFFWATIHALNLFFGSYIVGLITRTGFIYASEWLFLSNIFDPEEIIFMIVSFIALIIAGYLATRHVITSADSDMMIAPKVRVFYLFSKVLFPWIMGTIILFAINFPNNPLELWLLYVMSILVVLPMFVNMNSPMNQQLKAIEIKKKHRIGWEYIILAILALILFRMGLYNGINYG